MGELKGYTSCSGVRSSSSVAVLKNTLPVVVCGAVEAGAVEELGTGAAVVELVAVLDVGAGVVALCDVVAAATLAVVGAGAAVVDARQSARASKSAVVAPVDHEFAGQSVHVALPARARVCVCVCAGEGA